MNEQLKGTPLAQFMSYMESKLKPKEFEEFRTKVQAELLDRAPVVAIIGKAGVGQTTTINNLFDVDDYVAEALSFDEQGHIGDVRRGTTTAIRKRFDLKIGIGLDIIDLPGLGDDIRPDQEFEAIYRPILPQCDIILYVLNADNRTFGTRLRESSRNTCFTILVIHTKIIPAVNPVKFLAE
jgi:Predicted GTPase